ncbi:sensor histidine kinase [Streptomyces oceani]|uniref:sensor histidine kinase n=1 Tax=Streptomyces oceani TaxID=1075402 RepID=UPI003B847DA7
MGATLVVALALVAAGFLVIDTLRGRLGDTARLQAESAAREVAAQVSDVGDRGVRGIEGLDGEEPVQIVDAGGRVLGATEGLHGRPALAEFHRPPAGDHEPRPDASASDDTDESADDGGDDGADDQEEDSHEGQDQDQDQDEGNDDPSGAESPSKRVTVDRNSADRTLTLSVDEDGEVDPPGEATGQQDFRVVAVQAVTRDDTPVTVYAGVSLASQERAVESVRRSMLIGLPVLLAVVAAVTWLVTRRALLPVEGIRRGMAEITGNRDLSRRVPEPAARDEVGALARTTNETLAALEESVERQRRFVADVSHELRSPIASLRTQLEVGAAHPELLDLEGAVQDTVRLQELAADLLLLARLDAGERPGDTRLSLPALVRAELDRRADVEPPAMSVELPEPDGGTTSTAVSGEAEVLGSRGQLTRVLGNLLDNARRHAESVVRVVVRTDGAEVVLAVTDDGPGVPEEERERIFQRFVRLDDARSRDAGGAGLGLAIARDVAERHGGTLAVRAATGGGACFELRLPMAAEAGTTTHAASDADSPRDSATDTRDEPAG